MQQIIPPPDLTITLSHFCHYCECETDHIITFLAYNYQHRAVSYKLHCTCQDDRENIEYITEWLNTNEWIEVLSEISDSVRRN